MQLQGRSTRVRHVCGRFTSDGNFPSRWYLRAVFSSMPAFTAAIANVLSVCTNPNNRLTCRSVTIQDSLQTVALDSLPRSTRAGISNCRQQGSLIVAHHSGT